MRDTSPRDSLSPRAVLDAALDALHSWDLNEGTIGLSSPDPSKCYADKPEHNAVVIVATSRYADALRDTVNCLVAAEREAEAEQSAPAQEPHE